MSVDTYDVIGSTITPEASSQIRMFPLKTKMSVGSVVSCVVRSVVYMIGRVYV